MMILHELLFPINRVDTIFHENKIYKSLLDLHPTERESFLNEEKYYVLKFNHFFHVMQTQLGTRGKVRLFSQ